MGLFWAYKAKFLNKKRVHFCNKLWEMVEQKQYSIFRNLHLPRLFHLRGSTPGLHHSHKWMQCFAVATRGSLPSLHWGLTDHLCLLSYIVSFTFSCTTATSSVCEDSELFYISAVQPCPPQVSLWFYLFCRIFFVSILYYSLQICSYIVLDDRFSELDLFSYSISIQRMFFFWLSNIYGNILTCIPMLLYFIGLMHCCYSAKGAAAALLWDFFSELPLWVNNI